MPVLDDLTLEENSLPNSHYGYSATRIEHLGATEYTVTTIVCDVSGSTEAFALDMEAAIAKIVQACKYSPRADNLLLRLVEFNDTLTEAHGFKLLENCNTGDYSGVLHPGGSTALYDAAENAISAAIDYGERLAAGDFSANAILFVITDGMDNESKLSPKQVRQALAKAVSSEALESIVSVLIGVNVQDQTVSQYLKKFYQDAGFTQYVEIDRADTKTLARLARFVSQSISAQSQSLGTGGPSKTLVF
jgi:uncharacterized protein YegL